MPKKINNSFDEKLTFRKFLEAHNRAKQHKKYKSEVIKFELNLEPNIKNLINQIKKGTYKSGEYRVFVIKEPKERIVKALPYVDRIVHQWYVEEFIKPNIVPKFINTTFACLEGRGTHKAVEKMQKYMRNKKRENRDYWILKCDIKKFFYSINNEILFNILNKNIRDKKLLNFTKGIIFENNGKVGLPIGNYTSQYFANIYLNELDQYIKRELKVKYYIRYMDDFIILLDTKQECKQMKEKVEEYINTKLKIELNEKSRYYPNKMGVNFCGYRIFNTHRLLRTSSKKRIKEKIKIWNKKWTENKLDFKEVVQSMNSWYGHIRHCDSYKLKNDTIKKCNFIYEQKAYENQYNDVLQNIINQEEKNQ